MTVGLRTLAFAELDSEGVWGAAWVPSPGQETVLALGSHGEVALAATGHSLSAHQDEGEWNLAGAGAELLVAPVGEPVPVQTPEDAVTGWMQVCRVTGRSEPGAGGHSVDCLGLRTWWSEAVEPGRYESVRAASTWFGPEEALAVTAFRPRKVKGHDKDVLAAAVIAPDVSAPVEDPRLSTTYAAEGWPVRAGLELWLAGQEETERPYPHRASGEATGARAQVTDGQLELRAERFRWHSRGREGAGMYLIADRR